MPNFKYLLIKKFSLNLKESTQQFLGVRNENAKEGTSHSQARENHYNQRISRPKSINVIVPVFDKLMSTIINSHHIIILPLSIIGMFVNL